MSAPLASLVPETVGASAPRAGTTQKAAPLDTHSISGNLLVLAATLAEGQQQSSDYIDNVAGYLSAGNDLQTTANGHLKDTAEHLKTGNDLQTTANGHLKDTAEHLSTGNDLQTTANGHLKDTAEHLSTGNDLQTTANGHLKDTADHLKAGNDLQTTANVHLRDSAEHLSTGNDLQTTANRHLRDSAEHLSTGNDLQTEANGHALRAAMALERIDEKLHILCGGGDRDFESIKVQIDEHHRRILAIAEQVERLQTRPGGEEAAGGLFPAPTQDQMSEIKTVVEELRLQVGGLLAGQRPGSQGGATHPPPPPSNRRRNS
jgi:uncharacterized protein (DUF952 family)